MESSRDSVLKEEDTDPLAYLKFGGGWDGVRW